jgi:hypothetical protein
MVKIDQPVNRQVRRDADNLVVVTIAFAATAVEKEGCVVGLKGCC